MFSDDVIFCTIDAAMQIYFKYCPLCTKQYKRLDHMFFKACIYQQPYAGTNLRYNQSSHTYSDGTGKYLLVEGSDKHEGLIEQLVDALLVCRDAHHAVVSE